MKLTAKGFVRLAGAVGLAVVCGAASTGNAFAQTQNSLNFRHVEQQKPSSSMESSPTLPETMADVMVAHENYAAAIEAYRKIQPQTAQIYNKIGIAYQRMAMDQAAIESYGQATKLDNRFAAPYNNLGTIYFHQNDNKRAKQLYKKSIKLDGAIAPYWSNLGAAYMAERKYSDGAEAYEKAFLIDPNIFQEIAINGIQHNESPEELAKMYLTFAEIYAHAGMKTQAILYLHKALEQGLQGREKLQDDQQLATLRGTPEFDAIVGIRHK
jgi:tetratricopeptide (TPR) repeat protein